LSILVIVNFSVTATCALYHFGLPGTSRGESLIFGIAYISGCDTFHLQQFFEGTIDKFTVKARKIFP